MLSLSRFCQIREQLKVYTVLIYQKDSTFKLESNPFSAFLALMEESGHNASCSIAPCLYRCKACSAAVDSTSLWSCNNPRDMTWYAVSELPEDLSMVSRVHTKKLVESWAPRPSARCWTVFLLLPLSPLIAWSTWALPCEERVAGYLTICWPAIWTCRQKSFTSASSLGDDFQQ